MSPDEQGVDVGMRVLVLAPLGRDASLICGTLKDAGLVARPCSDLDEVAALMSEGAGALVLTDEALRTKSAAFTLVMENQPRWSDFPVTILSDSVRRFVGCELEGATVLRRPLAPETLISVVWAGLRARRRQYQLKANLDAERAHTIAIVENIYGGYVLMDVNWRCLYVNRSGAALLERPREELLGIDLRGLMPHWRDNGFTERVQKVIETGEPFEVEEVWPRINRWFEIRCGRSIEGISLFISDITARKTTEAERAVFERTLQEARDRLALALHSAAMGLWDWNMVTGRLDWSEECKAVFGLAADAEVTVEKFGALIHPEDRSGVEEAANRCLDPQKREAYHVRFRVIRPDGGLRWVSARGRVYFDGESPIRFIGTAVDITREKSGEDRLRLLVDELSHRVKNTLAVIQTIANQTFKGIAEAERFQAFEGRLRALAQTHSLLTESNWESVDLPTLVRQSVCHLACGEECRLYAPGPPVKLAAKASLAIGMILHELATNAAKYGALASSGRGGVEVKWWLKGGHLVIAWRESGVAGIVEPSRRGFGTRLIDQMVEYDLEGEIERSFASDGFQCLFRFPERCVLASADSTS